MKTNSALSLVICLALYLAFSQGIAHAEKHISRAAPPPFTKEEEARILALPWLDKLSKGDILVRFDNPDAPRATAHYSYSEKNGFSNPWGWEKFLAAPSFILPLDLNGDEHIDMALKPAPFPADNLSVQDVIFYANCGNGWYLKVLKIDLIPGKNIFTLTDGQPGNDARWKTIEIADPDRLLGRENTIRYEFRERSYLNPLVLELCRIPWIEEHMTVAYLAEQKNRENPIPYALSFKFDNPDDQKPALPVFAELISWYMPVIGNLEYPQMSYVFNEVDINSDGLPDLLMDTFKESAFASKTLWVNCGNGWYAEVFRTTTPELSLGPADKNGWVTLTLPSGFYENDWRKGHATKKATGKFEEKEVCHYGLEGYVPYTLTQSFVNELAATRWVANKKFIYRLTPDGMETFILLPAEPAGDGTPNYRLVPQESKPWPGETSPLVPFFLNDDSIKDYYMHVPNARDSTGMEAYSFFAGVGRGLYVCVLEAEHMGKDKTRGRSWKTPAYLISGPSTSFGLPLSWSTIETKTMLAAQDGLIEEECSYSFDFETGAYRGKNEVNRER